MSDDTPEQAKAEDKAIFFMLSIVLTCQRRHILVEEKSCPPRHMLHSPEYAIARRENIPTILGVRAIALLFPRDLALYS
jgi:hypothetical protein